MHPRRVSTLLGVCDTNICKSKKSLVTEIVYMALSHVIFVHILPLVMYSVHDLSSSATINNENFGLSTFNFPVLFFRMPLFKFY